MATNKLSIYLVKDGIENPDDIFVDDIRVLHDYSNGLVSYYKPSFVSEPEWMNSFFNYQSPEIRQSNARVCLYVPIQFNDDVRIFILTFGHGKFLINEDVLEEQFGLKILLNSVDKNELRKIGKINIGGNQKASQEQIPKNANIAEFGFDIDRDLVRIISAKTKLDIFEKSMLTGGDIFSLSAAKDITNIVEFLKVCYEQFRSEQYKENFDWVDNIKEVKNNNTKMQLDNLLLAEINAHHFDIVYMAVPEVVKWEDIKYFMFSGNRRDKFTDIFIDKVLESFDAGRIQSLDSLKNKKIYAISPLNEREHTYEWSAYKCIFAEILYEGNNYCFNGGKWYLIHQEFAAQINRLYNELEIAPLDFPGYNFNKLDYEEGNYNQELAESLVGSKLLHGNEVYYGGGSGNNIEVCDVITPDKFLIHVKHHAGSSVLSHLFNQAAVSGEALLDVDFRQKVIDRLQQNNGEDILSMQFRPSEYRIIIAIITQKQDERPSIPFFSKVTIRYAIRTLKNLGYAVFIKNIGPLA